MIAICKVNFPPNIFPLPRIQSIDLSYNPKLIGFLPKFQSRSSLKELRLLNTNFSGEFPGSISNLKSLNYLDLFYTKIFDELPSSINNLKFLNYLDLSSSNFSRTIPPSIGNLSQLTHLSLSYNNFHGQLPSILGNLKSLNHLDLDSSNISGAKFPLLLETYHSLLIFPSQITISMISFHLH